MRLLAVAALCLSVSPVLADEAPQGASPKCGPIAAIKDAQAHGIKIVELDAEQRARALKAYNEIPVPSDLKADHVWVVDGPTHQTIGFFFSMSAEVACAINLNAEGRKIIIEAIMGGAPS